MTTPDHNHNHNHDPELDEHLSLLETLTAALDRVEPIPKRALELAYAARLMAYFEAELAELVFDSSAAPEPAMRHDQQNRSRFLTFANEKLTLDLSLSADGHEMLGRIEPASAPQLFVELADADPFTISVDQAGRFTLAPVATSFRIRVPGHLITPWISLDPGATGSDPTPT